MASVEIDPTPITEYQVLDQDINLPITYVIDQNIPIINGRIKFFVKDFNAILDVRVKQVKGQGAYYADKMTKPGEDHLEILKAWITPEYRDRGLSINIIYYMIRKFRRQSSDKFEVKPAPVQARISELFRKGAITHRGNQYFLNYEYANKIIQERKF